MPVNIYELLPTAKEIQRQEANAGAGEGEEGGEKMGGGGGAEKEKIRLSATVIQRAVRNALSEVQIYRFPNSLCTDRGRTINQGEAGWETTLTGIPLEIFQLWSDYLKPRGYRILFQIIDFPGGMPGD